MAHKGQACASEARAAIWPELREGGSLSSARQGFNTIHFIFPTTEYWIKAALVQGEGVEGREEAAPSMAHRPPSPWASHPGPLRVGEQLGWSGGWTTSPGTCLIWAESWLRGWGQGKTQAQPTAPSEGGKAPPGCCPHFWAETWVPAASGWVVRAHTGSGHVQSEEAVLRWVRGCPLSLHPPQSLTNNFLNAGPLASRVWAMGTQATKSFCPPHPKTTPREPINRTHPTQVPLWLQK